MTAPPEVTPKVRKLFAVPARIIWIGLAVALIILAFRMLAPEL